MADKELYPTEEDSVWIERERDRIYSGEYDLPIWYNEAWFTEHYDIWRYHFPYVSKHDPRSIAYTESFDKGRRDIQTRMRPGRYLARYFSEVLTPKQIAAMAQWQITGSKVTGYSNDKAYVLAFADTPDAIVDVYMRGPQSCMDGRNFDRHENPTRVYGAGDLAIAYLLETETDKVRARTLVWPAKKVVGRVYPTSYSWQSDGFTSESDSTDCANELYNRLASLGYRSDSGGGFNGARLLKIGHRYDSWIMPYLDHDYGVDDAGEHWTMTDNSPDYPCQETEGHIGEPERESWTCDNCDDTYYDDDEQHSAYSRWTRGHPRGEVTICEYCAENHTFWCEATEETYLDSADSVEVSGIGRVVQGWADAHCYVSDHSGDTFDPDNDPSVTVYVPTIRWTCDDNGIASETREWSEETWTQDEADDDAFRCKITGRWYPSEYMHPDHDDIWSEVPSEELAAYLAQLELDLAA